MLALPHFKADAGRRYQKMLYAARQSVLPKSQKDELSTFLQLVLIRCTPFAYLFIVF